MISNTEKINLKYREPKSHQNKKNHTVGNDVEQFGVAVLRKKLDEEGFGKRGTKK